MFIRFEECSFCTHETVEPQNTFVQSKISLSNMETLLLLRSDHIYMEDTHCAEPIFIYKLWFIVFAIFGNTHEFQSVSPTKKKIVQKWPNLQERCRMC